MLCELFDSIYPIHNVKLNGAVGGGADDREAIQNTIDLGGITFFPPGEYNLSVAPGEKHMLRLRENTEGLMGLDRSLCTLKVADGQPPYTNVIKGDWHDHLQGLRISGLTFDQNLENNPVSLNDVLTNKYRSIGIFNGENIKVSDCRFTNFQTMNNIMLGGPMHDLWVVGCLFDNANWMLDEYHDYSGIYMQTYRAQHQYYDEPIGSGMYALNNIFRAGGAGRKGNTTAIETNGGNTIIRGNIIEDFQLGVMVTGADVDKTEMISVTENHLLHCRQGVQVWSMFAPERDFIEGPGIQGCDIGGNHILIDLDAWAWRFKWGQGIWIPDWNTAAIHDLSVHNNFVRFADYTINPLTEWCNGMLALNHQPDIDRNWLIAHNIWPDTPGDPVQISSSVDNLIMDSNID